MTSIRKTSMMNKKTNPRLLIDGMILVNKPMGLTSNAVLQQVKNLFCAKKAGHTGSLDPLATGMLPICFGEATKFSQYLLDADKCYEVTGLLGIKTNTADALGDVIARVDEFDISDQAFNDILSEFRGSIKQVPSMFSALKHQGKPLYKFAREGIEIARVARDIVIHDLQMNAFDGREFKLTVRCSKGTYIRNLVEDIGERLNVGAHVIQLHRSYTAGLEKEVMFSLDELALKSSDERLACLLPTDRAIDYMPKYVLTVELASEIRLGKPVYINDMSDFVGLIRLYDNQQQFIGLGERESLGVLKPKRLIQFNGS